jgi:tetratricopeptide (TPR) repeat protein
VIACGLLLSLSSTASAGSSAGREVDDLAGPPAEVFAAAAATTLDLPALPSFELPSSEPGFVGPRELRLRGRRHLGTQVQVRGYVTWIYDCVAELAARTPEAKRAALQRSIEDDPTQCERPKLTLGETKATPRAASISVVEVPRPPNKLERKRLPAAELAAWPAVPKVAVGDYVVITGQWTTKAPRGDASSEGLLVYRGLTAASPPASEPAPATAAAPPRPAAEDAPPFVVTEAPLRKVVPVKVRADSITQLGDCNRASATRDFDSAIRACRAATATWEGNHLAWYTLASAHMAKGQWPEARATVARAVTLRPDVAMYQLYHGVALYEEEQQARKAGLGGSSEAAGVSSVDTGTAALQAARDALRRAVRLNPSLWRAHFYLARTYQELDDSRRAAEQLVATIKAYPSYRFVYVALVELLRRWGYDDAALEFALLGTRQVSGADAADLWIFAGMLSEERGAEAQALEAFGKALALRPDDGRARLQRGQALLRAGDLAGAKADLQAALRASDPHVAALRPFIGELLEKIERGGGRGGGARGKKR